MAKKKFITRNEAAEIMGVSPSSISNYIERGLIKAKKHGPIYYIDRVSFDTFISTYNEQVKPREDGIKALQREIEERREELKIEKERLEAQIMQMKKKRTYNMMINLSMFADFFDKLLEQSEGDNINDRERTFVKRISNGATLGDLSENYGLSRERVRYTFYKGLRKAMDKYSDVINRTDRENELLARVGRQSDHICNLKAEIKRLNLQVEAQIKGASVSQYLASNKDKSQIDLVRFLLNTNAVDYVRDRDASVRLINCLRCLDNIYTAYDLVTKQARHFLKHTRNFGRKTLVELEEILASDKLSLGMEFDKDIVSFVRDNY